VLAGAAALVIAYLLGSIPTGYLVTRALTGTDVRAQGSGATGATNVRRLLGTRWGIAIAVFDLLKGGAAVLLARQLSDGAAWPALAGVVAVVGHCWPVWLGFKGGKGVATAGGAAIALSPWALVLLPVIIAVVALSRFVSLGSLSAAVAGVALFVALALADRGAGWNVVFAVLALLLITFTHRGNITRLRSGTERRLGRTA
jgi:acyl phosphate:glycerol-3-phosphate acyltransferase